MLWSYGSEECKQALKTALVRVLFWFGVGSVESPYLVSIVPYLAGATPYLDYGERSAKRNCWPSIQANNQQQQTVLYWGKWKMYNISMLLLGSY